MSKTNTHQVNFFQTTQKMTSAQESVPLLRPSSAPAPDISAAPFSLAIGEPINDLYFFVGGRLSPLNTIYAGAYSCFYRLDACGETQHSIWLRFGNESGGHSHPYVHVPKLEKSISDAKTRFLTLDSAAGEKAPVAPDGVAVAPCLVLRSGLKAFVADALCPRSDLHRFKNVLANYSPHMLTAEQHRDALAGNFDFTAAEMVLR